MIPYRSYELTYADRWPKHIIIHHSAELKLINSSIVLDKPTFQYDNLEKNFYLKNKSIIPYNYVIEKVGSDFQAIVGRPILTKYEFEDIDLIYTKDLHIGLIGDYDKKNVDPRLYQLISFKIISPYMRLFNIEEDDILLHRDISYNPDETSPGNNFNLDTLKTILRSYIKRKSVTKSK